MLQQYATNIVLGYVVESSRIQRRALEKGNRPSFDFASQFTQIGTGDGDRDAVSPIIRVNQQNSQLIQFIGIGKATTIRLCLRYMERYPEEDPSCT